MFVWGIYRNRSSCVCRRAFFWQNSMLACLFVQAIGHSLCAIGHSAIHVDLGNVE